MGKERKAVKQKAADKLCNKGDCCEEYGELKSASELYVNVGGCHKNRVRDRFPCPSLQRIVQLGKHHANSFVFFFYFRIGFIFNIPKIFSEQKLVFHLSA